MSSMHIFWNNVVNVSMSRRNLGESKTVSKLTAYGCNVHLIYLPTKDFSVQNKEGQRNIYCNIFWQ